MEKVIVFTVDGKERARLWLNWALRSVRKYLSPGIRVFVLTDHPDDFGYGAITVDARPTIEKYRMNRVEALKFQNLPVNAMQIFRLALPVVPELLEFDKAVFLDCDLEIKSGEWEGIFDIDVDDYDVAAALDSLPGDGCLKEKAFQMMTWKAADKVLAAEARDRLLNGGYFCAGGMVMNLRRMREKYDYPELLSKLMDSMIEDRFPCLDQDALNLFCRAKIIPSKWHAWWKNREYDDPGWIFHHAGKVKYSGIYPPDLTKRYFEEDAIDVLYVVGDGSKHDNQELRWSLRSIAKYGRNIRRVIVAGSPPDWLSDEVVRCPITQQGSWKAQRMIYTELEAVRKADIHGHFLVSADDHFYINAVDMARHPFYIQNWVLPVKWTSGKIDYETLRYRDCLRNTHNFLSSIGYPTVCFSSHINAHFHAELMMANRELFEVAYKLGNGLESFSLMQNIWLKECPELPLVYRHDRKFLSKMGDMRGTADCFSIGDGMFDNWQFLEFMDLNFGEKCRYEK